MSTAAADDWPEISMTTPTTHREVERKLRVHALFRLPSLSGVTWGAASVQAQPAFTMLNTYYDTPDLRLFRWGVTLRRREGGPDEGWHMKLPVDGADAGTRDEIRVPLTDSDVVPVVLRATVTALVREASVGPVVTLRTERTPILLLDAHGRATAELVDDTVAVLDGERTAAIFREIEVEGVPGPDGEIDVSVLDDVVAALVDHGAVPGTMSKAASALGPRTAAPPDVPVARWPQPADPAGEAVRAHLATHVRRFLLNDVRLRRRMPDALHQLRVAARRLRSGLRVFRPLIDAQWADELRAELAWAAGSLGAARDTEVLITRFDAHADLLAAEDATAVKEFIDPLLARRLHVAEDEALATLATDRYARLLQALVAAVGDPHLTAAASQPCSQALPPLVAKAFQRLTREAKALDVGSPAGQWHEARITAKKARYAAEALAPVFGKRVEAFAAALSEVTEVLGTHQDAHVAQVTLRELAESADGSMGYLLGLLHGVEIEAERADREAFLTKTWPRARKVARHSGML
jgi:CHAD domain-containing protein